MVIASGTRVINSIYYYDPMANLRGGGRPWRLDTPSPDADVILCIRNQQECNIIKMLKYNFNVLMFFCDSAERSIDECILLSTISLSRIIL